MIISTISDIKKIIFEILFFILSLLVIGYIILLNGVKIDHLNLFGTKIEKLYLKLDKKLILHIHSLSLPIQSQKKKSLLPSEIQYINLIPMLFQEIIIDKIKLPQNSIRLIYTKDIFTLKTNHIEANISIIDREDFLYAHIKNLIIKQYSLHITGNAKIDKSTLSFRGRYKLHSIEGRLNFSKRGDILSFFVNSQKFTNKSLAAVMKSLPLHPDIKIWSYKKIKAHEYKLLYAKGVVNLKKIDPKKIEAVAVAKNVLIHFHPDLDPVNVQKVTLHYKNDNLYFHLYKPQFHEKDLSESKVTIYSLNHNSYLDVDIRTKTPFDKSIQKILLAYNINLPLLQTKGRTEANLLIRIRLKDMKTDLIGRFFTQHARFLFDSIPIYAQQLLIKLQKNKIIFKNSLLSIPPYIASSINGYIDLHKNRGKLDLKDMRIDLLLNDQSLLAVRQCRDTLLIDLIKNKITLLRCNTQYDLSQHQLYINHIEDLKGYSTLLKHLEITSGNAKIDLRKMQVFLKLKSKYKIFLQNEKPIQRYIIGIDLKKKSMSINNFASIKLDKEPIVQLKKITVNLFNLQKLYKSLSHSKQHSNAKIYFTNTIVRYKKHTLTIPKGSLILKNDTMKFVDYLLPGKIILSKSGHLLKIHGLNLTAKTLNQIIGKDIFYRGNYNLSINSQNDSLYRGILTIKNGYMKDLKLINNFVAFINTIPALVSLSDPGFSKTGLPIVNGKISFIMTKDKIIFTQIKIKSIAMNITGKGFADFTNDKIKLTIHIETLKNVSKIIKNIPIAGYILLGKDGRISTTIEVSGKASDPKFHSLLPKETIKAPINILKRTLELPFKIFE